MNNHAKKGRIAGQINQSNDRKEKRREKKPKKRNKGRGKMCNVNIYRQAHIQTDGLPIERKRRLKVAFVLPSLSFHNSTKRMML
jgi:hypothetical protein